MADSRDHLTVLIGQLDVMMTLVAHRVYRELRPIDGRQIPFLPDEDRRGDKVYGCNGYLMKKKKSDPTTQTATDCDHFHAKSLHDSGEIGYDSEVAAGQQRHHNPLVIAAVNR